MVLGRPLAFGSLVQTQDFLKKNTVESNILKTLGILSLEVRRRDFICTFIIQKQRLRRHNSA